MSQDTTTELNGQQSSTDTTTVVPPQDGALPTNPPAPQGIDYKAKWEEEALARKAAEDKIVRLKRSFKGKAKPTDDTNDDDEDDVETTTVSTDVEAIAQEVLKRSQHALTAQQLIYAQTQNPDERRLIEFHLGTIQPSGDLAKDVRRATLLANEDYYTNLTSEQIAMIQSKQGTTSTSPTSTEKPVAVPAPTEDTTQKEMVKKFQNALPPRYKKQLTK